MAAQIFLSDTALTGGGQLVGQDILDNVVGLYSGDLNRAAVGRVVHGRGEAQGGAVFQGQDGLDRALAKSLGA